MKASLSTSSSDRSRVARLILCVFLIVIALDILVSLVLKQLLYGVDDGRYYKMRYSMYENRSDILVVGSSIAETGFVPSVFQDSLGLSCWNAGRGNQGQPYVEAVVRKTLERYTPKAVLITIQPLQWQTPIGFAGAEQMKPLCRFDRDLRSIVYPGAPLKQFMMNSGLVAANSSLFYMIRPLFEKGLDGKREELGLKTNDRSYIGETISSPALPFEETSINEDTAIAYRKLIELLVGQGSKVVFVTYPYFQTKWTDTRTFQAVRSLAEAEDEVYFLNYWADPEMCGNRELFSDPMHVNRMGATKLSGRVAHDLKMDVLQQPR